MCLVRDSTMDDNVYRSGGGFGARCCSLCLFIAANQGSLLTSVVARLPWAPVTLKWFNLLQVNFYRGDALPLCHPLHVYAYSMQQHFTSPSTLLIVYTPSSKMWWILPRLEQFMHETYPLWPQHPEALLLQQAPSADPNFHCKVCSWRHCAHHKYILK